MNTEQGSNGGGTIVPVIPMSVLDVELPLYLSVLAGFPSPADDYLEERLSLDKYLIKHPDSTFFVKVEGLSMVGAGIYPDDILIVDRSLEAKPGDVIVAVLDGEFTVKRLVKKSGRYALQPENPDYKLIPLDENAVFTVWGVVTNVIHKPYEL
ncbi:MAG: translesion error-prone DNA polymerase V autoproteolytic subunit [Phaeodactylibacter sp.]|nr:translesion error-prone DNA polymerase V autoproteolytic subunit [Phaeodactylibacter sp.]MCB9273109.1 translesion error-prone DNA polymerase V autoproteolytic subunit [Lewinellaceae bacterium]